MARRGGEAMRLRYLLGCLAAALRLSSAATDATAQDTAWGFLGRPTWWTPAAELSLLFAAESKIAEAPTASDEAHRQHISSSVFSLLGVNNTGASTVVVADVDSGHASQQSSQSVEISIVGSTNTTETTRSVRGRQKAKQPLTTQSWFAFLRFSLSFAFVIKCLCMASNVIFQVSPFPLVKSWKEQGETGDTNPAPFVTVAYGGCQWCFYGLFAFVITHKTGFLVLVYSNVVGATLGIYYVFMFERLCADKAMRSKLIMYLQIAAAMAILQAGAMLVMPAERALFLSGIVSSVCSIVGTFSLCVTIPFVIQTKCSKSMPLPLLLASYAAAVLWTTCGVMLWDPWITVPNILSFLVLTFALGLVWMYPADGSESPLAFSKKPNVSTPYLSENECRPLSTPESTYARQISTKKGECAAVPQYGSCMGETGGTPMPPDRTID